MNEEIKTENYISYDEFLKVDITFGTILSAEKIENTDKLLKLIVDFGDNKRQIVSGISQYFPDPQTLVGKQTTFVLNLEPRTIKGHESQGMLFATGDGDNFSLIVPEKNIPNGQKTR